MFKNLVEFAYQEGEKVCRFVADHDTDIQMVKRALCDILKRVGLLEDQIRAAQEKSEVKDGQREVHSGNAHEEGSTSSSVESA
jgi:hypothetical protein